MDIGRYKQWTLLEWEEQFRMEEANICAYFEELPKYIDLPDEDDIIISNLKEKKLILEDSPLLESITDFAIDYEEEFFDEDINVDTSSSLYYEIGELAESFCDFLASVEGFDKFLGLGIVYALGRVVSIHFNIMQLDSNEFPELKKALLKREFFILNKLLGLLGDEKLKLDSLSERIDYFKARLHNIREKNLDLKNSI